MNQNNVPFNAKKRLILKLEYDVKNLNNFECITDERRKEIINKAKNLKKNIYNEKELGKDYIYKLLFFITDRKNLKDFNSLEERYSLLIEILDPTLEIYKSYELNSKYNDIKEDVINKIGFFNKNFIKLEKLYILRFYDMDDFNFERKLILSKKDS